MCVIPQQACFHLVEDPSTRSCLSTNALTQPFPWCSPRAPLASSRASSHQPLSHLLDRVCTHTQALPARPDHNNPAELWALHCKPLQPQGRHHWRWRSACHRLPTCVHTACGYKHTGRCLPVLVLGATHRSIHTTPHTTPARQENARHPHAHTATARV